MFPFKKKNDKFDVGPSSAAAVIIAVVALCVSIGAARWSWFAVDDLVLLRQDLGELKSSQEQLKIQFDFWDTQVSKERATIRQMKNEMDAEKAAAKPAPVR